jgi:hypothetical protein
VIWRQPYFYPAGGLPDGAPLPMSVATIGEGFGSIRFDEEQLRSSDNLLGSGIIFF